MSRLPFEAFLALRYLRPRRTFVSVITIISILGVTLGVAVLIIVISVMSGFDREWRDRILGFNAHLKVFESDPTTRNPKPMSDYNNVLAKVAENKQVVGVAPFIRGQILVETQPPEGVSPQLLAPLLMGVDPERLSSVSVLPTNIVHGEFDLEEDALLIGEDFADGMGLYVGDRVAVYSRESLQKIKEMRDKTDNGNRIPVADEFVIRGIFNVGYPEYNAMVVVSSLENAQRLYGLEPDTAHGLQVMLGDPFQADAVRRQLMPALGNRYYMQTWLEETPHIFNALASEKTMMFFLLFFIMIVAGFGIINSQITFVVQKTREIGILKALGSTGSQILWLFLSQSLVVAFTGVLAGLGLGLLALAYRNNLLQVIRSTGFDPLPASIYQIYDLPASVETPDVALICGAAFVACILAGLFPAWKASRLQPVEALRYE